MTRKAVRTVVLTNLADFLMAWRQHGHLLFSMCFSVWHGRTCKMHCCLLYFRLASQLALSSNCMINIHNLISGGTIGVLLMILAFIAIYLVFFRDTEKPRKEKQSHHLTSNPPLSCQKPSIVRNCSLELD